MKRFNRIEDLQQHLGESLGSSPAVAVTQTMINGFAEATGDHQWIHVDTERAARAAFGGTIAHGFLLLSLIPQMATATYRIDGFGTRINYGLNRVRFIRPVRAESQLRAEFVLKSLDTRGDGQWLMTNEVTLTADEADTPACVAESLALLIP